MKTKPFLTIFFSATMLILSCSRGSFDIIIKDVNIIDVHTGELMTSKVIGISMGEITKISNIPLRSTSDHTIHIDGRDKFVIPGLCDSHTHLAFLTITGGDTLTSELADFTHRGVLYVRDVGGPIDVMSTLKSRITSGELAGPEIFYTGPMFESSPLYWGAFNNALPDFTVALDNKEDVDSLLLDLARRDAKLVKTFNNIRTVIEISHIVDNDTVKIMPGRTLAYLKQDSVSTHLEYGDIIVFSARLNLPEGPKNPGEFDYANYLTMNDIQYTVFISGDKWNLLGASPNTLMSTAINARKYLLQVLQDNGIKTAWRSG